LCGGRSKKQRQNLRNKDKSEDTSVISGFHYRFALKSFPTFAFTFSSILMSGGQERLKPSPGNFFVAWKFME
jgi:hypothetical protein